VIAYIIGEVVTYIAKGFQLENTARIPNVRIELEVPYPVDTSFSMSQRITGIYIIQNVFSDRCYLGASLNVPTRLYDHQRKLIEGYHGTKDLQRDYNASPEHVVFRLIEVCEPEELAYREYANMMLYDIRNANWGYNSSLRKYKLR